MRHEPETTSQRPMPMHVADAAEIQAVLSELASALVAGEGERAATCWQVPALVLGDTMDADLAARTSIAAVFDGALEEYRRRGIVSTQAQIQRLEWLSDTIALVTVRWPTFTSEGHEVGEETSTYLFKRDASGTPKLRVAVAHGFSEQAGKPS